jgi:hypothetical protein
LSDAERITELEQAIIDIAAWLQAGEGVSPTYYAFDLVVGQGHSRSVAVIEELLRGRS